MFTSTSASKEKRRLHSLEIAGKHFSNANIDPNHIVIPNWTGYLNRWTTEWERERSLVYKHVLIIDIRRDWCLLLMMCAVCLLRSQLTEKETLTNVCFCSIVRRRTCENDFFLIDWTLVLQDCQELNSSSSSSSSKKCENTHGNVFFVFLCFARQSLDLISFSQTVVRRFAYFLISATKKKRHILAFLDEYLQLFVLPIDVFIWHLKEEEEKLLSNVCWHKHTHTHMQKSVKTYREFDFARRKLNH